MQEKKNQTMINEEKLLKKLKREASETIERVESGLYNKVYDYRKNEIEKFYSDESEEVARNAALRILEQNKEEDMLKYEKAKLFLQRLQEPEEKIKLDSVVAFSS